MTRPDFEVYHTFTHVQDGLRLHTHDHYEINCVLEGTSDFRIGDQILSTGPGSVLLINSGIAHNVVRQTSERYERVYLHINRGFLASVSTTQTDLAGCFHGRDGSGSQMLTLNVPFLNSILTPLLRVPDTTYGSDIVYRQAFISAMIAFNTSAQEMTGTSMRLPKPSFAYSPAVITAMRLIDEQLQERISLDDLARACSMNKYSLVREFRKELDITPGRFLLLRRIERARRLLAETGSASLVYRECGFSSYTYFLRCFKKETGMTTTQFVAWSHLPHADA